MAQSSTNLIEIGYGNNIRYMKRKDAGPDSANDDEAPSEGQSVKAYTRRKPTAKPKQGSVPAVKKSKAKAQTAAAPVHRSVSGYLHSYYEYLVIEPIRWFRRNIIIPGLLGGTLAFALTLATTATNYMNAQARSESIRTNDAVIFGAPSGHSHGSASTHHDKQHTHHHKTKKTKKANKKS